LDETKKARGSPQALVFLANNSINT